MTWTLRHEGSPHEVRGLSSQAVLAGLTDGQWDTTDEVRSDSGGAWQPLEQHPAFAEAAADVEPPPRAEPADETRLDMNPLIDVCLVLLIFFILTTTYETIRKVLNMPGGNDNKPKPGITKAQLEKMADFIIRVQVRSENGVSVIKVEDQVVSQTDLLGRLSKFVKSTEKKQMLLDAKGVEWGVIVDIMDEARAAGVQKILFFTPSG